MKTKSPPRRGNTTALLPHFNEPFIRESVLSIAPFVEEVIVADTGSDDKYLDWLYSAAKSAGNVRIYRLNMREQPYMHKIRNFLHEQAQTEWLLLYDSDCIAYTDKERCLTSLYEKLEHKGDRDHFSFITPYICGDFNHYLTDKPFHPSRSMLYKKGLVKYEVKDCIEYFQFDTETGCRIKDHYWLGTDLKTIERMAFRGMMDLFVLANPDPKRLSTLWEWMHHKQTGEYPSTPQQVFGTKRNNMSWQRGLVQSFEPFDYARWGPHPERLFECEMLDDFVLTKVENGYTRENYPFYY
ncbi:MAG: glycosyltransferase family 2 protein [Desulfobulbaceae bacterium]|nr:glycosyltransferase family 2 protein [Desulfobulbaceae bacterium]